MGKKESTTPHQYAELFPLHEGQPLWDLSNDIKSNGQEEPIILYQEQILDGRRRELACLRAGVEPKYKQFKGKDSEALALVISRNLHRRHLGEGERALVAAKIAKLPVGIHQNAKEDASKEVTSKGDDAQICASSQGTAASMMNVSRRSVQIASDVLKNASPSLLKAVEATEVSISDAAKIVDQPAKVQAAAVKAVKSGKSKTAAAFVAAMSGDDSKPNLKDSADHEVPENLIPSFEALKKFEECDSLCRKLQSLIDEVSKAPGGEQIGHFLQPTGGEKFVNKSQHLNELKRDLRATRPYSVCPWCKGEAPKHCKGCKGNGWVSKITWDQAEEDVKASVA